MPCFADNPSLMVARHALIEPCGATSAGLSWFQPFEKDRPS